jgi:tripartite-type tricarboxylate transporter receptor subunit TctC
VQIWRMFALVICFAFIAPSIGAQNTGTVKIVVAFPPGGPVDFVARVLSEGLAKDLNQSVLVDNRPGANGAIAAQLVAKSPPDGNTLWLTSAGAAVMNPALYEGLAYDMQRDFAAVSVVVNNEEVLVVNAANKANSVAELIAQAKAQSEALAIASSGIGSMPHLAMELLADSTKANLLHVPYKGAAPAIADVMGNQVVGFFGDVPGVIGLIKGGKLKALGIAAQRRNPMLADVSTLDEQGIHGVESNNWYALFAPARTPSSRIAQLNAAVRRLLTSEPYHSRLINSGAEPDPTSPEELVRLIQADGAKWGKIIRDKKIKGE